MKLYSIVLTLDNKQLDRFLIYIELYHNKGSAIYKIALWLNENKIWHKIQDSGISTGKLHSQYPTKINSQSFLNTLTTLGNLAEEFLGWLIWKDSENLKRSCQLTGLARKSLSVEYVKTQKSLIIDSESQLISVWDDFYKMRALFNDYYYNISFTDNNYIEEFRELLLAFRNSTATIAQLLFVEIRNREILLSESWDKENSFFHLLYNNDTKIVHITDLLIQMIHQKDIYAYEKLKEIIYSDRINNFSRYVKYSIIAYCYIFLTGYIKEGGVYRGQELLDLYEFGFDKGIISLNESVSLNKFNNIIGIASKFEKYEWARNLVDKWSHKIDKHNSKAIATFGHATIDFHQKKYENVIVALSKIKTTDFIHKLRARWLLLKAQYENNKNHIEIIRIQVVNFRRFLISNESRVKQSTFEAIKASLKILSMVLDRKDTDLIMEHYKKSKYVFERRWVMQTIKNPMR